MSRDPELGVTQPHSPSHFISVNRRRFDHLAIELSVSAGELVPRYALWLRFQDLGCDPVRLEREDVRRFIDDHLADFLIREELVIPPRETLRLRKRLLRYDPRHPSPEEVLHRIFTAAR
jgi:hypothetical protein